MADDSAVLNVIQDLDSGMIDANIAADVNAYVPVYISGDKTVTAVATNETQANVKKLLGWSRGQAKYGYDTQVPVKTRFRVLQKGTAGELLAAGDPVKHSYAASDVANTFLKFVEDTDGETEFIGVCWVGGADTADIEVLLF